MKPNTSHLTEWRILKTVEECCGKLKLLVTFSASLPWRVMWLSWWPLPGWRVRQLAHLTCHDGTWTLDHLWCQFTVAGFCSWVLSQWPGKMLFDSFLLCFFSLFVLGYAFFLPFSLPSFIPRPFISVSFAFFRFVRYQNRESCYSVLPCSSFHIMWSMCYHNRVYVYSVLSFLSHTLFLFSFILSLSFPCVLPLCLLSSSLCFTSTQYVSNHSSLVSSYSLPFSVSRLLRGTC